MTFEELWSQVQGLPETAKSQLPASLSEATRKKLARKTPDEVSKVVAEALDEVNYRAVAPLEELIKRRL